VFFQFILHGAAASSTDTALLFGLPVVTGAVAAAFAATAVLLGGWRAGFAAAALGALLFGAGLVGDLVSHGEQEHERQEILQRMVEVPSATSAHQLMELDGAETRNAWHFVTAGGQGLLMAGFAGAAFVLWQQSRRKTAQDESTPALQRQAA
jgi:hypothetical protein